MEKSRNSNKFRKNKFLCSAMPSIRIFANSIIGHFSKRSERIYTTDSYNTKKWTEVD